MATREARAIKNIRLAANYIIGGLENTIADTAEGSEDNAKARAELNDHNALVETIYNEAITRVYGAAQFKYPEVEYLRHIRFLGREWLIKQVDEYVTHEGY